MTDPKTLRIFIGGVAALVPRGRGRMTVLMPAIDHEAWKGRGYLLHEHHAFLGYHPDQWDLDLPGGQPPPKPSKDGSLHYLKLEKTLLDLQVPGQGEGVWAPSSLTRWLPRDAEDCTHRHWVTPMINVEPAYSDVRTTLLRPCDETGEPVHGPVQVRAELSMDRGYSWRLGGRIEENKYKVSQYELKCSPTETARFSQALASVVALDRFVGDDEIPLIELSGGRTATLRISRDVTWEKPVDLLIVQLIPDSYACLKTRDGIDAHFRTYYGLSAADGHDHWLKVPFEVEDAERILDAEAVGEAMPGIFFGVGGPRVAPDLLVPDGYSQIFASGPPLCPQVVFNESPW